MKPNNSMFSYVSSRRDIQILVVLNLIAVVVLGIAAIEAFSVGRIAAGVQHSGVFGALFCALIGPKLMGLVNRTQEPQLSKLNDIVMLFCILATCSGALARVAL